MMSQISDYQCMYMYSGVIFATCYLYYRYNPENLGTLEKYIHMQAQEGTYDLEANLAVLKL